MGLWLVSVAPNQFINGDDESVEFAVSMGVEFSEFLKTGFHALRHTDYGLVEAVDEFGGGFNIHFAKHST